MVRARHPLADLVGERAHVVGRGHHRAQVLGQALGDIWNPRLLERMEHVPALDLDPVPAQLRERGDAPHVRSYSPVVSQEIGRRQHLVQDRSGSQQLHLRAVGCAKPIHAAQDPFLRAVGHRRVPVVLVHQREVEEHVLLLADHAP